MYILLVRLHNKVMKVITVRNVPDTIHEGLVRLATSNRRSLQQQILQILESACERDVGSVMDRARSIRTRLTGRDLGDSVKEIRKDRER